MRRVAAVAAVLLLAACGGNGGQSGAKVAPGNDAATASAKTAAPSASQPAEQSAAAPRSGALTGQVSGLSGTISDLRTRVTDMGTIVELPSDTLFAFDSDTLSAEAEGVLRKALDAIRRSPPGPIGVIGHTDGKGDDAYNRDLSERRAQAVAAWLAGQPGIRQRERRVEGRGEAEPLVPNTRPDGSDDPQARTRNRRVELVLPTPD